MNCTDEDDIRNIAALIECPVGFGVSVFGDTLHVARLETGEFQVLELRHVGTEQETITSRLFTKAVDAAAAFIEIRHNRKLGFDYETGI